MPNDPMYSFEFLSLVDLWQDQQLASEDLIRLADLSQREADADCIQCSAPCFRKVELTPAGIAPVLLKRGKLLHGAGWTASQELALRWKLDGVSSGQFGVIFKLIPEPQQVILNLERLHESQRFRASVDTHGSENFREGIEKYENREREVILGECKVFAHHVWALRPPQQSVGVFDTAFDEVFGTTEEDWERHLDLHDRLDEKGVSDKSVNWLTGSAASSVLINLASRSRGRSRILDEELLPDEDIRVDGDDRSLTVI
jgi:hypothetical protein